MSYRGYRIDVPVVRSVRSCVLDNGGRDLLQWASYQDDGRDYVVMKIHDNNQDSPRDSIDFLSSFVAAGDAVKTFEDKNDPVDSCNFRAYIGDLVNDDLDDAQKAESREYIAEKYPVAVPVYLDGDRWGCYWGIHVDMTGDILDPLDSGWSGWLVVTPESWRREMGNVPFDVDCARHIVESECKTLDCWLRGNIFGLEVWDVLNDDVVDSCWGFYDVDGDDDLQNALVNMGLDGYLSASDFRDYDDLPDDDEIETVA